MLLILLLLLIILLAILINIFLYNKKSNKYNGGGFFNWFRRAPITNLPSPIVESPTLGPIVESPALGPIVEKKEYNFRDYEFFENVFELANSSNLLESIIYKSQKFKECIKYKGCKLLLRNILMLTKEVEFGKYYDYTQLGLPLFDTLGTKFKFKPFQENYWTDDFDIFISYYEEFKDQPIGEKQSYYFYWLNLINISQILVIILHNANLLDITSSDRQYRDKEINNKSCYIINTDDKKEHFNEIIRLFMIALNCDYYNIFQLYVKIIEYDYIFCIQTKEHILNQYGIYEIYMFNTIIELRRFIGADVYLLLTANNPDADIYGRFEGTKFMASLINPFIYIHHDMTFISSFVAHDLYFHSLYKRKKNIGDDNWNEFKEIIQIAKNNKYYPMIFAIINYVFHEPDNIEMPAFTIRSFIKNIPVYYFGMWCPTRKIKKIVIKNDIDDEKLFQFLLDAGYISQEIYDSKDLINTTDEQYLEDWEQCIEKWNNYNKENGWVTSFTKRISF